MENSNSNKCLKQHLLHCCLINARSLVNKLSELHYVLYSDAQFDCLLVTESWLTDDITDGMLDPEFKYHVLRCDRGTNRGGGVCAFIKRSFRIVSNTLVDFVDGLEIISFDLLGFYVPYRFFVVYRPPSSCMQSYNMAAEKMSQLVKCLESNINPAGVTLILGDFNCPDVEWKLYQCSSDLCQKMLCDFAVFNGFTQCTPEPTRSGNLLDLVLVNDSLIVSDVNVSPPFSTSDHNSVNVSVLYTKSTATSGSGEVKQSKRFKWEQGDYDGLCSYLAQHNWNDLFTYCLTVDDLWKGFRKILDDALDIFVPSVFVKDSQSTVSHRKQYPAYIRKLIARKNCLWRHLKRLPGNTVTRAQYRKVCTECKHAIRQYELATEQKIIDAGDSGQFFKYVNKKLGRSHDIGILNDRKGETVETDADKAELLNHFFSSVNVTDNNVLPDFSSRVCENTRLDGVQFQPGILIRLCQKIKPKLSQGPDGYPPYLLKRIISVVSDPVCRLFQAFMSVGKIPSEWKSAVITPLYKKGVSSDPSNYRPVSLTSVFSKLMERVVVLDMIRYFQLNNLINKQQHGFIKKRCTATNLLESLSDWTLNIENGRRQAVAYIDFAKAFDSVCHSKLLLKLKQYGVCGSLLEWIGSFLTGRTQQTRVGNTLSDVNVIISGVVQGSCLGPTLFLIYINDLVDVFSGGVIVKLYADDVKLYSSCVANVNDIDLELQNNLDKLYKWAHDWQLPISYAKCNVLEIGKPGRAQFRLDSRTVAPIEEVNDLGVTIDSNLKFSIHVNRIVSKAHRRANLILRCFVSRDLSSLVRAFNVYVRPILEYCSVVWNPYLLKDIVAIEKVQRRFTKRLRGMSTLTYYQRLVKLGLESLELRRIRADLVFAYKVIFGLTDVDGENLFMLRDSNSRRRHCYQLYLPYCKSNTRYNYFYHRVGRIWNALPQDEVVFTSLCRFRETLTAKIIVRFCKLNFI